MTVNLSTHAVQQLLWMELPTAFGGVFSGRTCTYMSALQMSRDQSYQQGPSTGPLSLCE